MEYTHNYVSLKISKVTGLLYKLNIINNKFFIADNCPYTHIKKHLKYKHIYINNAFHWN